MPRHAIGAFSSNRHLMRAVRLGSVATACLLAVGCSKGKDESIRFGKYEIGKTTPGDDYVMGKCRPQGDLTFCFLNRSPAIANHKTQTNLFFRGHGDDAPLVEIEVAVWNCNVEPVVAELRNKLGFAEDTAHRRSIWRLKKMTVVALLPKEDELCMVYFVDNKDTKRIAKLFPGTSADTAKPAPAAPEPAAPAPAAPAPELDEPKPATP